MSDQGLNIPITVQTSGDAGQAAAEGLKKVEQATTSATAAARASTEALTAEAAAQDKVTAAITARQATAADKAYGSQMSSEAAAAMGVDDDVDERAMKEERINSIMSQRMAIIEAETELLAAERAGEDEKARTLTTELAVRREALALQRGGIIAEEEAMGMAATRVADEQAIATAKAEEAASAAATRAAEAEEGAASRVYGPRSKAGMLAKNFTDANTAASIGIGAFGGAMAIQLMEELTKKTEEDAIAQRKVTDEIDKQVLSLRELAGAAQNGGDINRIGAEMGKYLDGLQEKIDSVKTAPEGILSTLGKGASLWADQLAAFSAKVAGRGGGEDNPLNNWLRDLTKTEGEKQEEMLKGLQPAQATEFMKDFEAAIKSAAEAKRRLGLPLPDQAAEYEKLAQDAQKARDAQDRKSPASDVQWGKQNVLLEHYQSLLANVNAQIERQTEAEKKAADASEKKTEKEEEFLADLNLEEEVQQALVDGDDKRAKSLQRQIEYRHDLKRFTDEEVPDAEGEAKKLQTLRDQVDAKKAAAEAQKKADEEADQAAKDREKQQKIEDADQIRHDQATHNKRKLAQDERKQFEDEQRKKLEDANFSPDEVKQHLAGEMKDYDREHRGNTIGGPTKHAANDDLGKQLSDADWKKQFDKSGPHADPLKSKTGDSLDPNYAGAPLAPGDALRDIDHGPSADFNSLKPLAPPAPPPQPPPAPAPSPQPPPAPAPSAPSAGGGDGGAGAMQSAASALSSAGTSAGGALQAAAAALMAAASAIKSGGGGGGGGGGLTGSAGDSSPNGNPPPDNGG